MLVSYLYQFLKNIYKKYSMIVVSKIFPAYLIDEDREKLIFSELLSLLPVASKRSTGANASFPDCSTNAETPLFGDFRFLSCTLAASTAAPLLST
jgi:hypothetical protein